MTEQKLVWVRYRANNRAALGEWRWDEFWMPHGFAKITKRNKESADQYFRENYAEDLSHRIHHDGVLAVDWEFKTPPMHIVDNKARAAKAKAVAAMEEAARLQGIALYGKFPVVDTAQKRTCQQWPSCGCLVQNKTKDCREPFYARIVVGTNATYRVGKLDGDWLYEHSEKPAGPGADFKRITPRPDLARQLEKLHDERKAEIKAQMEKDRK